MLARPANRITALFEAENANRRKPSEKMVEANRRNAKLSTGPITAQGKANSSRNALKHGLLAKRFVPASDFRGDDRLYRAILTELTEEFSPETFTARALVDALALDYVQATRVRQMMELLQQPEERAVKEGTEAARVQMGRKILHLSKMAIARLRGSDAPLLTSKQAARVAERVAGQLQSLMENFEGLLADRAEGALPADAGGAANTKLSVGDLEFEQEEDRQLEALMKVIGRAKVRFQDRLYVAAVLSETAKPKDGDAGRLIAVLENVVASYVTWLCGQDDVEKKVARLGANLLIAWAQTPDRLILLTRYQQKIECAIDRKVRRLRRK
jgi:hypothetical protein